MRRTPSSARLVAADEELLVIMAMKGDDAAYGELVRRRQIPLRAMLRRLTRDDALADDIAQQAFLLGWKSIHQLKTRAAFGAWLRKLAVNSWLQHRRTSKPVVPLTEDARSVSPISTVNHQLDLDAALAHLPPDVRVCIVLAYSEGLSHVEISETAVLPLGTVKSHIARGTQRLRELLGVYEEPYVG